jgi:acetyl-CoA carboxylase carboxyl transferase subunit alpha
MFTGFMPLGGDRLFGEDQAIIGGFARLGNRRVMLIGHEKGNDTQSRIRHNFGMGKPEGYRKAVRLMEMASRFGLPVVTLVDTSGAFPGVEAEERGQAEAIARSTEACLALGVPMVATIVGEGGSGGAAGQRRARADAGTRGLFGDLARRLRLDPLAHGRKGPRSGRGDESDRAGSARTRRHRSHRARTGRRRSSRSGRHLHGAGHGDWRGTRSLAGKNADALRALRAEQFLRIGA